MAPPPAQALSVVRNTVTYTLEMYMQDGIHYMSVCTLGEGLGLLEVLGPSNIYGHTYSDNLSIVHSNLDWAA